MNDVECEMESLRADIKALLKLVDEKTRAKLEEIEAADERCKLIYRELIKVEKQRDELLSSDLVNKITSMEIKEKSDIFEEELQMSRNKCKTYEITLLTTQETVNALSTRLLESETEVERLIKVETDLETDKKVLEEKSQHLLTEKILLTDAMEKMERDIVCEVTTLKNHLESKLEHFRAEAVREVENKQSLIEQLSKENCDCKEIEANNKAKISSLEAEKRSLALQLEDKKSENATLWMKIEGKVHEINNLNAQLKSVKNRYKDTEIEVENLTQSEANNKQKIVCLEAEKSSLALQLEEERSESSTLRMKIEEKVREINNLKAQLKSAKDRVKDAEIQVENLHVHLKKENEMHKSLAEKSIEISDAEEKINNLEEQLQTTTNQLQELQERLENKDVLLKKACEEKTRLDDEITELIGHKNKHQRIKYVNSMKQSLNELSASYELLRTENTRLSKQLMKENTNPHFESSPKAVKNANKGNRKLTMSPSSILKERI